jgi:hypothetical protein
VFLQGTPLHKYNNNNNHNITMSATPVENVKAPRAPRKPTIAGKNKQILMALIAVSEETDVDFDSLLEVFGINSETLKDATATNEALNARANKYEEKFAELTGKRVRKPKGEGKKPRQTKAEKGDEPKPRAPRKPRSDKGKARAPAAEVPEDAPTAEEIQAAADELYRKTQEELAAQGVSPYVYHEEEAEEEAEEPEPIQVQPQKRKYTRKPKAQM